MKPMLTVLQTLLLGVFFISCDKPIEVTNQGSEIPNQGSEIPNQGSILIDDEIYQLTKLDIHRSFIDTSTNRSRWTMHWYSDSIEFFYLPDEAYVDSATGVGHDVLVYFLVDSINHFIPAGTYTNSPEVEGFSLRINRDHDNNVTESFISSSEMSFSFQQVSPVELSFVFNGQDDQGKSFSGSFTGNYRLFDVSN